MGIKTSDPDFVNRVVVKGKELIKIPQEERAVKWSSIFARSILKVANKLGVEIELKVKNDCFWIYIISKNLYASAYTEESGKNMAIIGFDYHRINRTSSAQLYNVLCGVFVAVFNDGLCQRRVFPHDSLHF